MYEYARALGILSLWSSVSWRRRPSMTAAEAASAISRLPVMELLSSSSLRSVHDTLIAGRDFVAGELLLELPLSAALTKDSAQALPIIRFLDAEDGRPPRGLPHWAALPDDFVLALQLMHLRRGSHWARGW